MPSSFNFHSLNIKKKVALSKGSIPLFLISAVNRFSKIIYFLNNYSNCLDLREKIFSLDPEIEVLIFPEFDCTFLANFSPTKEIIHERIKTLFKLLFGGRGKVIFLTSYDATITKTAIKEEIKNKLLNIEIKNTKFSYDLITNFIVSNNYEKVDFVKNKGEYALRGNILDVFSPNELFPVRISFDIDEVDSLHLFKIDQQISFKKVENYNLFPASEIFFLSNNISYFRENYRKLNLQKAEYYKALSNNIILPGSEQFYPILNKNYDSIFKYLENFTIFLDSNFLEKINNSYQKINNDFINFGDFVKKSNFLIQKKKLINKLFDYKNFYLFNSAISSKEHTKFSRTFFFNNKKNNLQNILKIFNQKNEDCKLIICIRNKIFEKKICSFFSNHSINYEKIKIFKEIFNKDIKVFIININFSESFTLNINQNSDYLFISEIDIFEKTVSRKTIGRVSEDNLIDEFSKLKVGDYVVHVDHGIGKYLGLRKQNIASVEHEFIEIEYQNFDKLLIPVENLELISKYGHQDTQSLSLDRLGLQNWQYRKAVVKKRIKEIAKDLVKTAAEREMKKGDIIAPNQFKYEKFTCEFEFTETSDQIKSINEIEDDLTSGKPMDRLICGDVGFGKTEIAMRAAFLMVLSGFQVAMICPKLLLANQHYKNFLNRFKKFDVKIDKLSRLESISQKKNIIENLKLGKTNILIGTHAILSKKIFFKNLGLIIIDEEQSFGVEQKERLKQFKPNVHVLTLSATPIPRTLQSSLFKLKDISLIKTPPLERLNIKTHLMLFDQNSLKKIISSEIDRNGQVFYVAPRIADLEEIKKKVLKIVPNYSFSLLHGRLKANEIERIYEDFSNNKIQILFTTAVIESGLDISNVNTIIIEKPYLFGLAQLYQLRGRVGRSSKQAYAYLILDNIENLKKDTVKKLEIISRINSLGAGFSIAASDLDIRGAGNLIGAEQSGHIKEVGVELYYKMVNESVNEIKNQTKLEEDWSPLINLGFSINIPEDYIPELDLRLQIYRKISGIENFTELKDTFNNLEDRFGNAPNSLKNLFKIIKIKILAKKHFVKKIDLGNKGFVITFKNNRIKNLEKIIELAKLNPKRIKLTPDAKILFFIKKESKNEKINDIINFIKLL